MAQNQLIRVRYAGKDFQTAFDELVQRIQTRYGDTFNDFYASEEGVMLIDLFAFIVDGLCFYLDRQATDTYLATATLKSAVALLCRQLGYKMASATAATVDLQVTLKNGPYDFDVVIPKGFQFQGPNQLVFESTQDVKFAGNVRDSQGNLITAGETLKKVAIREGATKVDVFTSDGSANQVFKLAQVGSGQYAVAGTSLVYVGGARWDESKFISFDQTNQYEARFNDSPPSIKFGDGVAGNIPPQGAEVRIVYVVGSGKAGRVTSGAITSPKSPLVINFQKIDLSISSANAQGGDDPEDLDHARIYAPLVYKARDVAVVDSDFAALANTFSDPLSGTVARAQSIVVRSADSDITLNSLLTQIAQAGSSKVADATAQLDAIQALADDLISRASSIGSQKGSIDSANAAILAAAQDILTQVAQISLSIQSIGNHRDVVFGKTSVSKTQASSISTQATLINGYQDAIKSDVSTIQSDVNTILGKPGTTTLSDSSVQSLLNDVLSKCNDLLTQASNTKTSSQSIDASQTLIATSQNSIESEADAMKSDATSIDSARATSQTDANTVITQSGLVNSSSTSVGTDSTQVSSDATGIKTDVAAARAAVVDPTTNLQTLSSQLKDHVGSFLSDDSKANLVTIPILTRDANGFLQGPSIALLIAVQTYLDGRTEPTVTIDVVDGSPSLVFVAGALKLKVLPGYVKDDVLSEVQKVVDGIFKAMDYNEPLRLDYLYSSIGNRNNPVVLGVDYVNISFTGAVNYQGVAMPGRVTTDGDVVPQEHEIITKGAFTMVAL